MNPELTVAAVVERQGRFLIVEERVNRRIVFNQPAGHVEAHEALVDAVIRETLEESAWKFVPEALVGIYLWTSADNERSFLRVAFCGSVRDQQQQPLDAGILRAHWLTRNQLIGYGSRLRSPMVLRCVDDYLSGARYPLTLLHHLPPDQVELHAAVV
jgi:ADP-ribose pyrophosphatase YjhB (NUDIX family)